MIRKENLKSNWSVKVVYSDQTVPTKVLENSTFEEAIKFAKEIDQEYQSEPIGFYISRD